mmetsp:Transcript_25470/g.49774  ORF Transcript_25470/g.49774 Transcript_25470/m.49774 type:complete len:215 (-) Transcript_25470:781-1425(-)
MARVRPPNSLILQPPPLHNVFFWSRSSSCSSGKRPRSRSCLFRRSILHYKRRRTAVSSGGGRTMSQKALSPRPPPSASVTQKSSQSLQGVQRHPLCRGRGSFRASGSLRTIRTKTQSSCRLLIWEKKQMLSRVPLRCPPLFPKGRCQRGRGRTAIRKQTRRHRQSSQSCLHLVEGFGLSSLSPKCTRFLSKGFPWATPAFGNLWMPFLEVFLAS